ncbi:MAG TPA: T9SS type A sorting domain-containing protein, partial [Candidatus Kapabacteria bacterium]|nr:T9SS type A sorting domain-containing protein [Candidatus Kapabacteria bacterium]
GFVKAGPSVVNKIAVLRDNIWNAIDSGVSGINAYVSVAYLDSYLLTIGGSFSKAGNTSVSNYAKTFIDDHWDSTFSIRFDGPVYAIANPGSGYVVGGEFTHANGNLVNNIAEGSEAWGSGVDGPVYALAGQYLLVALVTNRNSVYVGGAFRTAGGKTSPFFAVHEGPQPGGVKEPPEHVNSFQIFPNPATTEISINNSENITALSIINAVGRSVLTAPSDELKSPLAITNLLSGFYTVLIKSAGTIYSQKLIIQH